MRKVIGLEQSLDVLTKNRGIDFESNSKSISKFSKDIFGVEMTFLEYVNQILAKVKSEGDKGLYDLSLKIDGQTLDRNLPYIESCEMNIEVEFLKNEPVEDWRNWISKLLNREFSWDRLEFMASRIAKGDNDHPAIGLAKDFISDPDGGIGDILEKLPDGILEDFSSESLKNINKALTEFTQ